MAITGMFKDEDNQRTILLWMAMPLVLTFGCWIAVQNGSAVLRVLVWFSIVFIAFFIWIAAFSIGPYYLPVLLLLLLAGFAPWPVPTGEQVSPLEAPHDEAAVAEHGGVVSGERISAAMNPAPEE